MNPTACLPVVALLVLVSAAGTFSTVAKDPPRVLSRATLLDKIRGGWAGQMIGVAYGAPTEFKSNGRIGEWPLEWKPGMLENTLQQDDLYVEMTFAKVMDDLGIDAPIEAYGEAFRTSGYHLWHANAASRRLLNLGIRPPRSGHPKYNVHANDIDFQIEADFIGLMCPGLPRLSNRICDRVGRVMNYGDGLYGGMFVCGMYSAAYFESDPRKVVAAGLACIPADSGYALLIRDLLEASARQPTDWRAVWRIVQDRWDKDDPCPDGALAPFNIDARLNGAYIAFGLLFGGGDFERTMEISTRCGQDSDCNPSSAAGVLGVILGYDRIPERFKTEFPTLGTRKFSYTDYSFEDIVRSTERRALEAIRRTGGTVADTEVRIAAQKPRAPRLEQWNPGKPVARVAVSDGRWTWKGNWTDRDGHKASEQPGDEATFAFEGVAVAIVGRLDQAQGRARIYLDDHEVGVADGYIVERTHDNALWHTYGLEPGPHTLRIEVTGEKDPRSRGTSVSPSQAIVYAPAER
ncbi:MAG: ADP-ribosylglycohydrolase family protein [Verrucomicrobiales bacterium]|nr:ADP-ribosylglycohydrolase family protein [Verrucomicrobiales bacterium]